MLEKILISKLDHTDLNMYKCGFEDCAPGHSWGPGVRDHFLIHYVHKGKGVFHFNNAVYHLTPNQGFLICPDMLTHYRADMKDPWSYSWVGFHGLKAEAYLRQANLSASSPVFEYRRDDFLKDCLTQMIETKNLEKGREARLIGLLYIFISKLIEEFGAAAPSGKNANRKEEYFRKAVEFIGMNYSRKIRIEEISRYIGLDRSYLFSIFKQYCGASPQKYLINYRIGKACELMRNNELSIGDVSRSVGYEDTLLFSKVFKKLKGVSPREYRI